MLQKFELALSCFDRIIGKKYGVRLRHHTSFIHTIAKVSNLRPSSFAVAHAGKRNAIEEMNGKSYLEKSERAIYDLPREKN